MSAAPHDIIQHFGSDDLELHEVGAGGGWLPVEGDHRRLDSTVLVILYQNGIDRIAVKDDEGRTVEFDLREVILRDGSPLTTVEREAGA